MIYGERIRQVRQLKGWTQTELARRIKVRQSAIAEFENGRRPPTAANIETIGFQTGFPTAFFEQPPFEHFPIGSLRFRARRSMTARQEVEAHQWAAIIFEIGNRLAPLVERPALRLPRLPGDPDAAAALTRSHLGLSPDVPIANLVNAVEKAGVWVFALPYTLPKRDAFAAWCGQEGQTPIVAISNLEFGDRLRLSVAHELAHLVMHEAAHAPIERLETEANQFAAELLMPKVAIKAYLRQPLSLANLAPLKPRWGVSLQALIMRAYHLDQITDRQYRYLFEQLTVHGWRKKEPGTLAVPAERPRAFRKMIEVLFGTPIDYKKLSLTTNLGQPLLRTILEAHAPRPGQGASSEFTVSRVLEPKLLPFTPDERKN